VKAKREGKKPAEVAPTTRDGDHKRSSVLRTQAHKARRVARRLRHLGHGPIKKPSKRSGIIGKAKRSAA
jgi:hypothetical protein